MTNLLDRRLFAFFDDGESGGAGSGDPGSGEAGSGDPGEDKTGDDKSAPGGSGEDDKKYTDKDIDDIVNRKFSKWQKEQQKKIDEAARLAKMNAEEKAKYEREKTETELKTTQEKLAKFEMTGTARTMLSEKKVSAPDQILSVLVSSDADTTKANIDSYAEAFTEAVNAEVEARMKGKVPQGGSGGKQVTKAEINAIKDPIERQRMIAENLDLYVKK